jgi:hypothetical protein
MILSIFIGDNTSDNYSVKDSDIYSTSVDYINKKRTYSVNYWAGYLLFLHLHYV